jgi:uncharacterized membrane protein YgcG
MKLKYKCIEVHRGADWQLAVLVTHNDGTVEPWLKDTAQGKFFIPITSAAHVNALKEGAIYNVTLEEEVREESASGVSEGQSGDSSPNGGESGAGSGDSGGSDTPVVTFSEEGEPEPEASEVT